MSRTLLTSRQEAEVLQVFLKLLLSCSPSSVLFLMGECQERLIPLWKVFPKGHVGAQMPPRALHLFVQKAGCVGST